MKSLRTAGGFTTRPYFTDREIEQIAEDELREADLFPSAPAPVRIERFLEKRFGVSPTYEELVPGVLGFTEFGPAGVVAITVSRALSEENNEVAERRINTTLAHEAGHGLLHAHLFALDSFPASLFEDSKDVDAAQILCRDSPRAARGSRAYDGRWWEYQANRMIGALLLPRPLVTACLDALTVKEGVLESITLPGKARTRAEHVVADTFNVNPVVARIRLEDIWPKGDERQLAL